MEGRNWRRASSVLYLDGQISCMILVYVIYTGGNQFALLRVTVFRLHGSSKRLASERNMLIVATCRQLVSPKFFTLCFGEKAKRHDVREVLIAFAVVRVQGLRER
jgi:hypothetical protein